MKRRRWVPVRSWLDVYEGRYPGRTIVAKPVVHLGKSWGLVLVKKGRKP